MTLVEKIRKFIEAKGMSGREFSALSSIPNSNLSDMLNGNREPTLSVVKRAADAMGTTTDYLLNDEIGWPPPKPDDRTHLSVVEFKILTIAREVSSNDPNLEEARRRLLLIGFAPIAGKVPPPIGIDPQEGEKPANPGPNPGPGHRNNRKAQ